MKTLGFALIIVLILHISTAHAACQWSSVVQQGTSYLYSYECHVEVGKMMKREKEKDAQIADLKKSLEWSDLAINKANERIEVWQDSTYKIEDKYLKLERASETERWLWFGAGIVVMGAATYGAAKALR